MTLGLPAPAIALDGPGPAAAASGVVLAEEETATSGPTPSPTGTALLSAKVQAATMQDILPSAMPISVHGPVVDDAEVLSDDELAEVSAAVTRLEDETSLRLFVVYLETFDGLDPEDWADATATKSGLAPEDLLLAVATEDRVQGLSVDVNGPVTTDQQARILAASSAAVADGEWAEAATDAARAALVTQQSSGSSRWILWAALGAVAVGLVAWWIVRSTRARGTTTSSDAEGRDASVPARETLPAAVLAADAGLVAEKDDGAAEVARPAPPAVRPEPVPSRAGEASAPSGSGTLLLDDVRVLNKSRATEAFDALWQRAGGLDRRIERARKDIRALHDEFPAEALRVVTSNGDQADRLVDDARRTIDAGREAASARDRRFATAAARGAQTALEQAELLLDSLVRTSADLADVAPRLDKAIASLTQDVADAERLAGDDPQVTMARAAAGAALKQVEITRDDADPFTLLGRIAASEAALDRSLAGVREPAEVDARATALLRDTLSRLDVRLPQAATLIATRRAVVGPKARTHLDEATRLAAEARERSGARTDLPAALDLACRADLEVQQALDRAVQDASAQDVPDGMPLGGIALESEPTPRFWLPRVIRRLR
ncbi:TPM domain-containing protein [Myceligenerans crystallogenes]|uniref:TPM domain-containing protein n=2 Tax=Myceligenerans crystallogenes TaxID=316335 RepID=A0ABN2NB00_9MICO